MAINNVFKATNLKRMGVADRRGKKITEVINGIKIIKFNAWEKIMNQMILAFRDQEESTSKRTLLGKQTS